ncbi:prion-inhibition and propagation-domain-containing protein [Aspergillus taichungensis]|uniref:Prion-inhibition and propagation-domain-containing protein n=1 Tax=Aspergillus taichungensis TaxID=482145 RepID=A0A2J5HTR7_9EURO|nr:prion-inhibition and propagation-domain-containing protein [Aspergillus taichungensis]
MAEAAGLAVGAVSLISLAATCADAYRLRATVRDFQSDGSTLLTKILIERVRFYFCLKELGLVELESDQRLPFDSGTMQLVMCVFYRIQDTLSNAAKITEKYSLLCRSVSSSPLDNVDKAQRGEESEAYAMTIPQTSTYLPRDFWERHGLPPEENSWQQTPEKQPSEARISYRKKITWAISDKSRLKDLVEDLRSYNDSLTSLVPHLKTLTSKRLPSLILPRVSDAEAMSSIEDAAAKDYPTLSQAAKFKDVITKSDPRNHLPDAANSEWRIQDGSISALSRLSECYFTGDYLGTRVLVELRLANLPQRQNAQEKRVQALVQLLGETTKPTDFRVMDCLGYANEPTHIHWLIFSFPPGSDVKFSPINLTSLIARSNPRSSTRCPHPTSIERLRLAFHAALSLLQIHSVNWLHKDVKPDNFFFFVKEGARDYDLAQPWLAGFSYSRPFRTYLSSDAQKRETADFYLAPAYKQVVGSQARYQKRYEIYSLGLVLFEVGLWDSLVDRISISCPHCKQGVPNAAQHCMMGPLDGSRSTVCRFDAAYHFTRSNLHLLDDCMHPQYKDVVERCLSGLLHTTPADRTFDVISGWREWDDNTDENGELDQRFTMEVVQVLESMLS